MKRRRRAHGCPTRCATLRARAASRVGASEPAVAGVGAERAMSRVLVIDDDASLRFTLEAVLSDAGLVVETCDGGASGLAAFEARGADVVLTDLAMPEMDGMQVLERMRAQDPSVPVLMLTAHGSERVAVAAMKAGAFDYLPKPFDPDELVLAVKRAIETGASCGCRTRACARRRRSAAPSSPRARRCSACSTSSRASRPKDVTVLFTGESGAGKDVVATALHAHSRRADKPLIRFNAAAIPSELAEAELFGHTKGAFTGAQAARLGLLPAGRQGDALHRRDRRAAARHPGEGPARAAVGRGAAGRRARRDGRRAPRRGDQPRPRRRGEGRALPRGPLLPAERRAHPRAAAARAARGHRAARAHVRAPVRASATAWGRSRSSRRSSRRCKSHAWPGNVRELENTVARLLALAPDERLTLALWRSLAERPRAVVGAAVGGGRSRARAIRCARASRRSSARIIAEQFEAAGKNQSETARRLGVSRPALIEKLHKYGLIGR